MGFFTTESVTAEGVVNKEINWGTILFTATALFATAPVWLAFLAKGLQALGLGGAAVTASNLGTSSLGLMQTGVDKLGSLAASSTPAIVKANSILSTATAAVTPK